MRNIFFYFTQNPKSGPKKWMMNESAIRFNCRTRKSVKPKSGQVGQRYFQNPPIRSPIHPPSLCASLHNRRYFSRFSGEQRKARQSEKGSARHARRRRPCACLALRAFPRSPETWKREKNNARYAGYLCICVALTEILTGWEYEQRNAFWVKVKKEFCRHV